MSAHLARGPLLQASRRHLAAQAAPAMAASPSGQQNVATFEAGHTRPAELTTLPNGLQLANVDTDSPMVTLGVLVNTGSRHETYDQRGMCHALRNAAGLSTVHQSAFSSMRNIQQLGSQLNCTQGREHIFYSAQFLHNKVNEGVDYFLQTVGGQQFSRWEVINSRPRMGLELNNLSLETKASELLHKAAYRNGLGNPIYSPNYMIGQHTYKLMQDFYSENFTNGRATLVGYGISQKDLTNYAEMLQFNSSGNAAPATKAKYYGGEIREDCGGNRAVVCLAVETAGMHNRKEMLAAMVVQKVLGSGGHVKRGFGTGKLQQAVLGSAESAAAAGAQVQSFQHVYTDSGLVGATVACDAAHAGKVVSSVAATLRSVSVSAEELAGAKKAVLADLMSQVENPLGRTQEIAFQANHFKEVVPVAKIPEFVNAITLGEVQAVAKKLSSGKLSMSAMGNLGNVPYVDAL